jgi:iron uptake system EfeUOB component EfeO/EfeM
VSSRHAHIIDGHLRALDTAVTKIQDAEQDSGVALEALRLTVARTADGVKAAVESWSGVVSRECATLLGELVVQQENHIGEVSLSSVIILYPSPHVSHNRLSGDTESNSPTLGQAEKALQAACGLLEAVIADSQNYVQQNVNTAVSRMHELSRETADREVSNILSC